MDSRPGAAILGGALVKDLRAILLWGSVIGFVVTLCLLVLTGCKPDVPPPGAATCADVCHHGVELGCVWSDPTALGTACTTICEQAAIPWRLDCIVVAGTCAAAEACGRR